MGLTREQETAIAQLYQEMFKSLCIYAMSSLNDRSLAEEAVQDTFRIACAKPDDLLSSENPKGWLTSTLKNVIRNIQRSHAHLSNLLLNAIPVEEVAAAPSDLDFHVICADFVGENNYKLLKMISLDRYTMLEASRELGIMVEACKKRVQRTKKRLKNFIKENK